jgi:heat-inducible transcriptional repressor
MHPDLQDREINVLTTIVEEYIQSASPLGSRIIAKKSGLNLSPASIRNTMADLTDKGFLEQPHTSAGRIPTASAFRFYLDKVLQAPELGENEKALIMSYMGKSGLEITDILRQTSKLISKFSRQVSMVLAPGVGEARWRSMDFILVRTGLVMAVLVLDGGLIQNRLVQVDESVTSDDLVKFSNYLNHHFKGKSLTEVRSQVLNDLKKAERRANRLYNRALRLARDTFCESPERDFFVEGTLNILDQPEFSDIKNMRELLAFLEERSRLLDLLGRSLTEGGVKILLGPETTVDNLQDVGFVTSPYGGREYSTGVLGVIGPLRMDYAKVVPLVDFTAKVLTQMLQKGI